MSVENQSWLSTCSFVSVHCTAIASWESSRQSVVVCPSPLDDELSVGHRLRNWRVNALFTGRQLAEQSGFSQSKISKIETGKLQPSVTDVQTIGDALRVSQRRVNAVARMLQRTEPEPPPDTFSLMRDIELAATSIDVLVVTGIAALVQTPAFSKVVLRDVISSPQLLTAALNARAERQAQLFNRTKTFRILITTDGLVRLSEERVAWREQLEHICHLTTSALDIRELDPVHAVRDYVFEDVALVDGRAIRDNPMLHGYTFYDNAMSANLQSTFNGYWQRSAPLNERRIDALRSSTPSPALRAQPPGAQSEPGTVNS
jgi:transcriptional regulator with XRE-family HTH domain